MENNIINLLCCPICKQDLYLSDAKSNNGNVSDGILTCNKCNKNYPIRNGIPVLYMHDDDVITQGKQTEFSEFIITPDRLSSLSDRNIPKNRLGDKTSIIISRLLILFGWLFILLTCFLLINKIVVWSSSLNLISSYLMIPFIIFPIIFFMFDYAIYKLGALDRYEQQLKILVRLTKARKLSEFESRLEIKDNKKNYGDISVPKPKAIEIASALKKYNFTGGKGLNIGCGGELHQWVSKPFFNQGYNMLGVDISEEYLAEYKKIFHADGILANSLALPLKNDIFDVINYADILEHLHHPFLGLCEANRVLNEGGRIILATPYRCRFSPQCINPIIFLERVISLYYDKILGPRMMLSGFQDMAYYHLEFSKLEIINMLKCAGFEVSSFDTYFAKSKMLTNIFNKFPILQDMGGSILVIGVKRAINYS